MGATRLFTITVSNNPYGPNSYASMEGRAECTSSELAAFTADHVCRLTGLSARQLRYRDDTGFFSPTLLDDFKRRPFGRIYSFRDVVGLRTIAILRNEHKVPLQELRRVGEWLKDRHDTPWSSLRFALKGRNVVFYDPDADVAMEPKGAGQEVLSISLEPIANEMRQAADRLRDRTDDQIGTITRNRYVVHNAYVVAGTRIPTEAIWNYHEAGFSADARRPPRPSPEDCPSQLSPSLCGIAILRLMDAETRAYLDRLVDGIITAVGTQIADVRAEVGQLRAEVGQLRAEVGQLRAEVGQLRTEVGQLRTELRDLSITVDERFGTLDHRIALFETRTNDRFDAMSARFAQVETRLEHFEKRTDDRFDAAMAETAALRAELRAGLGSVAEQRWRTARRARVSAETFLSQPAMSRPPLPRDI